MAAEQRKALEQLMGAQVLEGTNAPTQKIRITDPQICRPYLIGVCHHDLFQNTKADSGACPKIHDPTLKAEWEAADEQQKKAWGFEWDVLRETERQIAECNREIDKNERRLDKTVPEMSRINELLEDIKDLEDNINVGWDEIRVFLKMGEVNTATIDAWRLRVMQSDLDKKRDELKAIQETAGPSGHQKLQVCDVCGAYLSRLDNDRRLADHFWGKMHVGYARMREAHTKLKEKLKGQRPPPPSHYNDDGPPTGPRDREYGGDRRRGGGRYRGGRGR